MAEDQPSNALAAAFPAPPPFFEHFTPSNIARIREAREVAPQATESDLFRDLPPELRFLIPPQPPQSGKYRSFGEIHDVRSLSRSPEDDHSKTDLLTHLAAQCNHS